MNPRKDLARKLEALRQTGGRKYWRSLEELADTEAFRTLVEREFPEGASSWPDKLSRRRFLALMGASLGLAGLSGCSVRPAPSIHLVPYVRQPEEIIPGRPLFYATAMTLGGVGVGLLVESHEGRPTKVEGNPDHLESRGATDVFHQASVLTLYDPDRSQTVTVRGQTTTWDAALGEVTANGVPSLRQSLAGQRRSRGAGLRLLSETVISPTLHAQIKALRAAFPEMKWHQYEPVRDDAARQAARLGFGEEIHTVYDFAKADVVVALDADFLGCWPGNLRYVRDFTGRRRVRDAADPAQATMNRLYAVGPTVTSTAAKADNRLALRATEVEPFARALAARLGVLGGAPDAGPYEKWITAIAGDLRADSRRGRSLILAGPGQPVAVHLLAHALNAQLGNPGQTVHYTAPLDAEPVDQLASLRQLVEDMDRGRVELLVILGGNPVYTAPTDFDFAARLDQVPLRAHLSLYQDETSRLCHWHLPEAHYLEAWGDTRGLDGTASLVQPLILPLYQGRSALEALAGLVQERTVSGRELVQQVWREHWQGRGSSGKFDDFWQTALHDGTIPETAFAPKSVSLKDGWQKHVHPAPQAGEPGYEVVFEPDSMLYDGRFANNGWLQECPRPITRLTWGNAAVMSPKTARELGVWFGDRTHGGEHGGYEMPVVELRRGERTVTAPVWIMPGHADGCISLALGYGREHAGHVGGTSDNPVGFNAYRLRTSENPWFAPGFSVRPTGETEVVACTQQHHLMEGRAPVRRSTLAAYQKHPDFVKEEEREQEREETRRARRPLTLYPENQERPNSWGMAIDLTACVGCQACVIACQAENNIPVVGKEQVAFGREMHWLRIDRYVTGTYEEPAEFYFQPVPCMHCQNAPCEYVCPTEATVHSSDGLNEMIYNRCVGTRFCQNNCPYKVRRFNFLSYAEFAPTSRALQFNPNVTVRSRGIMEKCTYCVQRIRQAQIDSQKEDRAIRDGEVLTACQAVCPANAIVFGDLHDPRSEVRRLKASPLDYGLLADLNTKPHTTYLGALRNPHSDLEPTHGD
jgi:molybdopterin-containing oxidoreductase family iron-sulfur binding subunit